MMHKYTIWLLMILFSVNIQMINALAVAIKQPSKVRVVRYKKQIEQTMKRRMIMQIGLQGVALSVAVFELYRLGKLIFAHDDATHDIKKDEKPAEALPEARKSWGQWFEGLGNSAKQWITSPNTWYNIAVSGIEIGTMAVFQNTIQYIMQRVFHTYNIAWFISAKAPYQSTIEEINQYAYELIQHATDDKHMYYRQSFITACNALNTQLEQIIAFMEYMSAHIPKAKQSEARQIVHYVFDATDTCMKSMAAACVATELSYADLSIQLATFEKVIDRELMHFARLDGSLLVPMQQSAH